MKIEITKEVENEINAMIGVARSASIIRNDNPALWKILSDQFLPDGWGAKPIPDTEDNLKVRLYAEMMKKKNEMAVKVERKIAE